MGTAVSLPPQVAEVLYFIALCTALTLVVDYAVSRTVFRGRVIDVYGAPPAAFQVYASLTMYIPAVSAITVVAAVNGLSTVATFLHRWISLRWRAIELYLYAPVFVYAVVSLYMVLGRTLNVVDISSLGQGRALVMKLLRIYALAYPASLVPNAILALSEEIGWRAFLTPKLLNLVGLLLTVLIVGLVWGLWHAPMYIFIRFKVPEYYSLKLSVSSYVALCILLSIPSTLFLIWTESILPAASLHGSVNALYRLTEVVTKIRSERKLRDLARACLASAVSWGISIALFTYVAARIFA